MAAMLSCPRAITAALAIAALLLLAGCGGSDDDATSADATYAWPEGL